jgi:phosphate transport system substrate-binding protein
MCKGCEKSGDEWSFMRRHTFERTLTAALAATLLAVPCLGQVEVDPRLPRYRTIQGVSGTVRSVGSDTLNNLMTLWAEKFQQLYPNVKLGIEGKGSSTAPPSLIAGTANFGPMSRPMKGSEIDAFERKFGYAPTTVKTAVDMVAVYVHKDNPVARRGLSLRELDAIFSSTRTGGLERGLTSWGEVDCEGAWSSLPISLYGRNSASGTYGFFKEKALFKGDFKSSVKEQPGSSSVVQGVASDRGGIGYSGIGYQTADVAAVPVAARAGERPVPPASVYLSEYPLARFLLVYVNKEPGTDLDPLRRELLKLIFSKEGQEVVLKDGYLPVSYEIARETLAEIGVDIEKDY